MKNLAVLVGLFLFSPTAPSWGQLRPPNDAGITMGEWYTTTRDVDLVKKVWIAIGGIPIQVDGIDVVEFPGVFVFIKQGQPSGGSEGSTIDHVGFHSSHGADTVAKLKAAGARMGPNAGIHHSSSWGDVYFPDGLKVEILDSAESTSAIGLPGVPAPSPLTGTIATDHIHFFFNVPESSLSNIRDWYAKTFGAVPFVDPVSGTGARVAADSIPGMELKFSKSSGPTVPTKGRVLDHIGFEVRDLPKFCKTLERSGVKLSQPYSKTRHRGYASAEFTDFWGTSVELTEGLNKLGNPEQ
jgi:hypothetical protein